MTGLWLFLALWNMVLHMDLLSIKSDDIEDGVSMMCCFSVQHLHIQL